MRLAPAGLAATLAVTAAIVACQQRRKDGPTAKEPSDKCPWCYQRRRGDEGTCALCGMPLAPPVKQS